VQGAGVRDVAVDALGEGEVVLALAVAGRVLRRRLPSPQYSLNTFPSMVTLRDGLSLVPANTLPSMMKSAPSARATDISLSVDTPPSQHTGTYQPVCRA
jgi:hypothetical protein